MERGGAARSGPLSIAVSAQVRCFLCRSLGRWTVLEGDVATANHEDTERDVANQEEPGLAAYGFARSMRGFDQDQVNVCLWRLERDRVALIERLERANEEISRLRISQSEAESVDADEVTRVVHLAERTAALVVSEAHAFAERKKAESRQILAHANADLVRREQALAAEAERVADLRRRTQGDISRAAARLVELVDGPHGLGPFSKQTGALLEFAELLARGGERVITEEAGDSKRDLSKGRVARPSRIHTDLAS